MRSISFAQVRFFAARGLAAAALGLPNAALSQELAALRPFGECRTGYWSSTRNLDDVKDVSSTTCLLNLKLQPAENLRLAASARLSQAFSAAGSGFSGRLREAYVHADFGDVSLKLGRQIVVWGRSDRISPTDVMSSRDFTARVPDDDEQRNGSDLAALRWQASGDVAITAYLGRFEPHQIPTGSLPAGLLTAAKPQRPEVAIKIDRTGEGVDFSVSYFDGFDKAARYAFVQSGPPGNFQSQHEHMQMAGADLATSTGRWTFRGEAAAFKMTASCALCPGGNAPSRKIQRAVAGVDRDFLDTANVNVQFFIIKRTGYTSPESLQGTQKLVLESLNRLNGEFGAIERGLTLRFSERFLNDLLKVEASSIFDLNNSSHLLRARASYAINDAFKLSAGVDGFNGKAQSFFGSRRKNSAAFVELAWVF